MSPLTKKLLRTIWSTKGQFFAVVAVVALGVSVYISMSTSYNNLYASRENFYQETNFADYFFHVVRAPQQVTHRIEAVPGVERATGRIQKDVPLIKENDQRGTVRLISFPLPMENEVDRLMLQSGRMFEEYPPGGTTEVLMDAKFVAANHLRFNDEINVVVEGKQTPLTVVGTATSPEFIYAMKDASSWLPEPETFGIAMIPYKQAQQMLNLNGQINQVVVKLAPGADEEKVAEEIKYILEPYGVLADYPRKQQTSHVVLDGELSQLKSMAMVLPVIFLGMAALIQLVIVGRIIKTQRLPIGVMKALGYNNRQIMLHYTEYALAMSFTGAAIGTGFGVMMASLFSTLYAQYFNLPQAIGGLNLQSIGYGFVLTLGVGGLAGITSSRRVTRINPADSMRPEPPKRGGRTFAERSSWLWARLDPTWKMGVRTVSRNRGRLAVVMVGVIFSVGMLVMSLFSNDSIDYMLTQHYSKEQKYDYLVRFTAPVDSSELLNLSRIEGVVRTEPILEVPAKVHFAGQSRDELLLGLEPDEKLKALVSDTEQPVSLPENGILISSLTAKKLGIEAGDKVEVETLLGIGPKHTAWVKVVGINRQLIGGGSYVDLEQLNHLLQERNLVSGAVLKLDPVYAKAFEAELNKMNGVSSVMSRQKELDNFNKNLESMMASIAIMVFFSVVLGFAIIYNSSVIGFAERKREITSLRVLGFTPREVSRLMLKETLLQSLLGVALGLPFGRLMSQGFMQMASSDLFTLPVVVYPLTYVLSALGGVMFIMIAHRLAVRGGQTP